MIKSILGRVVSLALTLCVLFGCVPMGAAAEADAYDKVADSSTMNGYTEYFTADTTEYAGLVWTDKSVFADTDALASALGMKGENDNFVLPSVQCTNPAHTDHNNIEIAEEDEESNFLVAMSASASNKSIHGYQTRPTDTVFVLDKSGSMESENRITYLASAVNQAITKLQVLNPLNRVGVVMYSAGELDPVVLMPLGRYTANDDEYIEVYDNNADADKTDYYVRLNSSVKTEDGASLDNSYYKGHNVNSTTYIQQGVYTAWKDVFKEVDDDDVMADVVINGDIERTVRRIPALILVTDGNPTKVTNNYAPDDNTGIGKANGGNGNDGNSTLGMAFLCQLTSIWVKDKIGQHYNGTDGTDPVTPLFYTLGIKIQNRPAASAILNPSLYLNHDELSGYWNTYRGLDNGVNMDVVISGGKTQVTKKGGIINNQYSKNLNYVDRYFPIVDGSVDEYTATLQAIVDAIELQSRYTATKLQREDGFFDGYLTFIDDIGEHMEVKDIEGLAIGNHLFSGQHIASMFTEETMGDWMADTTGTSVGYKLIEAIATRLGLSTMIGSDGRRLVVQLIDAAYHAHQIGPKDYSSETIGNSFGWYADASGQILEGYKEDGKTPKAFWDWNAEQEDRPDGAHYRIRSYIFYDEMLGTGAYDDRISEANTIFTSVQVREEIDTGDVSLVWRIPSRLIPINEYTVQMDEENEYPTGIKLEKAEPIRLIYEVGPKEGYKSYQIEETMRSLSTYTDRKVEDHAAWFELSTEERHDLHEYAEEKVPTDRDSIIRDEAGNYYLYTNAFDLAVHPDNLHDLASQKINTVAYYEPSAQNERFNFTKDTDIYVKNGENYELYSGETLDASGQYYFKYKVFTNDGTNDYMTDEYYRIHAESLQAAVKHDSDDTWYIPNGTIEFPQSRISNLKATDKANGPEELDAEGNLNHTGTYQYSGIATIEITDREYPIEGIAEGEYIISFILGNNGRLRVTPDTGIALFKVVPGETAPNESFSFTITRTDEKETENRPCRVVRGSVSTPTSFENGVLKVNVAAGELVRILGLPAGAVYSIAEESGFGHKLESITVMTKDDEEPREVTEAKDIEITAGSQVHVTFVNELPPEKDYGMLALKKLVSHSYKYGFDIPMDKEFIFRLTFDKYADDVLYDTDGKAYALDKNGMVKDNVLLKPNQEIVFTGLAEGTKVTVEEIIGPHEGYMVEEIISVADSVDVIDENTVQVSVTGGTKASVTVHNQYKEPYFPATGDESRLMIWTALLALCGVAAAVRMRKRV